MKLKTTAGFTSQILQIVVDDTSSTTGAGLGSLVYNSAGLAAKYKKRGDSVWTSISLQTITTLGTFQAGGGGFRESDSGAGGGYEFQPPDACFSTAGVVWIELYGAANMAPVRIEIELDEIDYLDGDGAGLSRLDTNVGSRNATTPPTAPTIATQVRTELSTELARIDENVSAAKTLTVAYDAAKTAAQAGDQMALVDGAISAAKFVANAITATVLATNAIGSNQLSDAAVAKIEAALLNEGDGQALIAAIIAAIDAADIDASLVAGLTRDAILDRVLPGNHDTADTVGLFLQQLDALISSRSSHTAANVWSSTTRTLSAFGFNVDLNADQSGATFGTVNSVNDKTGYALTQSFPANFGVMLINGSGEVTTSNPAVGSGSLHTPADVAALILANPANLLLTDASGRVTALNDGGTTSNADSYRRGQVILSGNSYANPTVVASLTDSDLLHLAYRKGSAIQASTYRLSTGQLGAEVQLISSGVDPHLLWFDDATLWALYSNNDNDVFQKGSTDNGVTFGSPTPVFTHGLGAAWHYEDVHGKKLSSGTVLASAECERLDTGESQIHINRYVNGVWQGQVTLLGDGSTDFESPELLEYDETPYILVASNVGGGDSYHNNKLYLFKSTDDGQTWDDGTLVVDGNSHVEYQYGLVGENHYITTTRNYATAKATCDPGVIKLGKTLTPKRLVDVGWSQDQGVAVVGDGWCEVSSKTGQLGFLVRDVDDGSDVDMTMPLTGRGDSNADLRIVFAYTGVLQHYLWLISTSTAEARLYQISGGGYVELESASFTPAVDTQYECRTVFNGTANTQDLYIDGVLILSGMSAVHATGKIGFGCGSEVTNPSLRQPVRCGPIVVKNQWTEDWQGYPQFTPLASRGTIKFAGPMFEAGGKPYVLLEDRDADEMVLYHIDAQAGLTKSQVDQSLIDYGGPTRAEATADKQEIIDRGNVAWVGSGGSGGTVGPGAIPWPLNVSSGGVPVAGVECWITTDNDPLGNVIAGTLVTDANGDTPDFMLDPGDYYLWRKSTTHTPPNPVPFTVS